MQEGGQFEFAINIEEKQHPNVMQEQNYGENSYQALSAIYSIESGEQIMKLQQTLKTQNLLLQYEEKRKIEKIKQIQYTYTNAYSNYLWSSRPKSQNTKSIILTTKDLLIMDQKLPEDIQEFQKALFKLKDFSAIIEQIPKPTLCFLQDFHNYFPNWHLHIRSLILYELNKSPKIQNCFQSEYSFAGKTLASLRESLEVQLFCNQLFSPILQELQAIKQQLVVDFTTIYQVMEEKVQEMNALKNFLFKETVSSKQVQKQLSLLFPNINSQSIEILIVQMQNFSKSEDLQNLYKDIGTDEVDISNLNCKLGYLAWRSLKANRNSLQQIVVSLINKIIKNFKKFPKKVRFVVQEWQRQCKLKYGDIKFEDIKSFFVKIIFSQLLFAQFMNQAQQIQFASLSIRDSNLTNIALISQKIMFGQQFYEKYKHGYFNRLIAIYQQPMRQFIHRFANQNIVSIPTNHLVSASVVSLETISYLYPSLVAAGLLRPLLMLQSKILNKTIFQIDSSKMAPNNIYKVLIEKPTSNYCSVFKPSNKWKNTLIQFLLTIETIPYSTPFPTLLEQYKCIEEEQKNIRPSVQIYAYFLSNFSQNPAEQLAIQIQKQIQAVKDLCHYTKIELQKELNFAQNLEKYLMNILKENKKEIALKSIRKKLNKILNENIGITYDIIDGKVCEIPGINSNKSIKTALNDISEYFLKQYQGADGLYHELIEKVNQLIQNEGVVDEDMIASARQIIGTNLYFSCKLDNSISQKDKLLIKKIQTHSFVDLGILQMNKLKEEQQLILDLSMPLLNQLLKPQSPQQMLKIFHKITLVFEKIIITTGKGTDVTADTQIPLMIFIILKSKINNLRSLVDFITKFIDQEIRSSGSGQILALVNGALQLIQNMDAKKLNMTEQNYNQLLKKNVNNFCQQAIKN